MEGPWGVPITDIILAVEGPWDGPITDIILAVEGPWDGPSTDIILAVEGPWVCTYHGHNPSSGVALGVYLSQT